MNKKNFWLLIKYCFLFIGAVLVILPLLFVLISSFKTNDEIFLSAFSLPKTINFRNYITVFNPIYHIHTYFLNSIFYVAIVCTVGGLIDTMAAYAIGRMKWKFNKLIFAFFLSGLMIPLHAILVPLYVMVSRFRMPNQMALMLLFIASSIPTSVFLIVSYLSQVPRAVEESAVIDGSSIPYLFITIVIPLIKPAIATVTIFNFRAVWNDLLLSLIFLNNESIQTLQLGLSNFKGAYFSDYGLILAALVVSIIPSIIVFL
ncbi:MAG: carbohydrate ABC transporter permease, partial [Treponema sp.]|nr:carbohydrate ABC transporter permease [Treponema sp.]